MEDTSKERTTIYHHPTRRYISVHEESAGELPDLRRAVRGMTDQPESLVSPRFSRSHHTCSARTDRCLKRSAKYTRSRPVRCLAGCQWSWRCWRSPLHNAESVAVAAYPQTCLACSVATSTLDPIDHQPALPDLLHNQSIQVLFFQTNASRQSPLTQLSLSRHVFITPTRTHRDEHVLGRTASRPPILHTRGHLPL